MCNVVSLKTSLLNCYEGLQDDAMPVRSVMGFVFPGVNINAYILQMLFLAIFVPQFWGTCLPIAIHQFPKKHCFCSQSSGILLTWPAHPNCVVVMVASALPVPALLSTSTSGTLSCHFIFNIACKCCSWVLVSCLRWHWSKVIVSVEYNKTESMAVLYTLIFVHSFTSWHDHRHFSRAPNALDADCTCLSILRSDELGLVTALPRYMKLSVHLKASPFINTSVFLRWKLLVGCGWYINSVFLVLIFNQTWLQLSEINSLYPEYHCISGN